MPAENVKRGLFLVYTGDGKGKTTAAFGTAIRAIGHGKRVLIIQFIKSPERKYGERVILKQLGVEIYQTGIGFTWTKTPKEHRQAFAEAWTFTKRKAAEQVYDLIILDELNNALAIDTFPVDDVLPLTEVISFIRNRPAGTHLIVTGRNAKPEITALADLVTEMVPVKHYYDEGLKAVQGLEW